MTCGYLIPPELAHASSYALAFSTLVGSALAALAAIVAFEVREAALGACSHGALAAPFLDAVGEQLK
jgi:hypothetical protein